MNSRILASAFCWQLLLLVAQVAAADEPAADKLADGWRKEVGVFANGKCIISVEQGWLRARRQTASGEVEWQIVLAKVTDTKPPEIVAVPSEAKLTINYLGGKYFIRERYCVLSCVREAKPGNPKEWPALAWPEEGFSAAGMAKSEGPSIITGWKGKSWLVGAAGPASGSFDVMVRLDRVELSNNGPELSGGLGLTRIHDGAIAQMFNDGELLTAVRRLPGVADYHLTLKNLVGSRAPEIGGRAWLNTDAPLRWSDLRGKVVLIDFWATWCPGCVAELPRVQEMFQKYKDQGFVVIGVHSKEGGDQSKVESLLKEHKLDFPVVLDDDTTTTRYAVTGWPTYFLVDRQGKVTLGFLDLPTNEQIEGLLKASSSTTADTATKEPEPPKIYDAEAIATQQIAEALAKAGKENKRVLLQFGANWCGWCQKLHKMFQDDAAVSEKLKSDYVVVLVDVDKDRNADVTKRYGQPTRFGLPAIVVLDAEGNQLTTKDTGELEEGDHHSTAKVLAFLSEWAKK